MSLPGAKVLIMGDTGTGKTYSIASLIKAGITPFILFTEPGLLGMSKSCQAAGITDPHPFHYHYIPPTLSDWDALTKIGENVNQLPYSALCKMVDTNKKKYNQWLEVIKNNNNFHCEGCGQDFGDIQSWGTDRAFVLDSLTGFSEMSMRLYIGGKVAKDKPDYQIAQDMIMRVLDKWTLETNCWFIMIAHEERESDDITGAVRRFPSSVGKAIAPDIPKNFSDVIEAVREGNNFSWDTAATGAATKATFLPVQAKQIPNFVTIVEAWKKAGGVIESTSTQGVSMNTT